MPRVHFLHLHVLRSCQRYWKAAFLLFGTALVLSIWSAVLLNPGDTQWDFNQSAALLWIGLLGLLTFSALDAYWLFSSQATTVALIQTWGGNPARLLGLQVIYPALLGSLAGLPAGAAAGILPLQWTTMAFSLALSFSLSVCSSLPMLLTVVFRRPTAVLREKI